MPPKKNRSHRPFANPDIARKLNDIYQDENGQLPNLTTLERPAHSLGLRAGIGFFAVLGVAALAAGASLLFLNLDTRASESDVTLTVEAPEEAPIGGELTYTIKYETRPGITLTKKRLQVNYPKGFQASSSTPAAVNGELTLWDREALGEKNNGEVIITGRLFGNPNQEQSLRAFFTYEPSTFQTEFQKVAAATTRTTLSPLTMSIEGADTMMRGREALYTLVLTNTNEETMEGLTLLTPQNETTRVTWNEKKTEGLAADKKIIETGRGLLLPPFEKEEQWRIPFSVVALEKEGALPQDTLIFEWRVEKNIGDNTVTIANSTKEVRIVKNTFAAELLINGKSDEVVTAPGEFLTLSIFYKNSGAEELARMTLKAVIEAPSGSGKSIFDWSGLVETKDATVRGEQVNEDVRRGVITWTAKEVSALQVLEPNEEGILNIQLPLKNDPAALDEFEGFTATAQVTALYATKNGQETHNSNLVTIVINSDTQFAAEVKPPASEGVRTMLFKIDNTWHPLKEVRVTTKLFGDIEWIGAASTPAGTLFFEEGSGAVTWSVPEMPVEAGVLALEFQFKQRSANPTQTALTDKILFSALDALTGKPITIEREEIPLN